MTHPPKPESPSPTPWYEEHGVVCDAAGNHVAGCWSEERSEESAEANAAHIVHCVNSYAALLKALREARVYVDFVAGDDFGLRTTAAGECLKRIDAALNTAGRGE